MGLKQIDESTLERFVGYMRTKMEQNVDKPVHWSNLDIPTLILKLKEEVQELEAGIATKARGIEIISECADVANFAMFLGFVYKYKNEVEFTLEAAKEFQEK